MAANFILLFNLTACLFLPSPSGIPNSSRFSPGLGQGALLSGLDRNRHADSSTNHNNVYKVKNN
jgi:hypothetical protein